jgi:hypothetical protein
MLSIANQIRKIASELTIDPFTQLMYEHEPIHLIEIQRLQKEFPPSTVIGVISGLPLYLTGATDVEMENGMHSEFNPRNHAQAATLIQKRIEILHKWIQEHDTHLDAVQQEIRTLQEQKLAHREQAGLSIPRPKEKAARLTFK